MSEAIKILLVDDEKSFVQSLAERLHMRNLGTNAAYDGHQAFEMLKEGIPDVMILDLRMPGIDGIEVLRRVKEQYPHVQVIILTGMGTEEDKKKVKDLGAAAYLEKPVDIDELITVIKNITKHE